ncbi:MAG: metallophosphoesterase family protein [Myxococcota bacterium]
MITFNADPEQALREMEAVLYYLTAFGYIDGEFDRNEKEYIEDFILKLAESYETDTTTPAGRARRAALIDKLDRKFQRIDSELAGMWDEPTAEGERAPSFVRNRMKLRCFEILERFPPADRRTLMGVVDELLMADGVAHPEELEFRDDLLLIMEGTHGSGTPAHAEADRGNWGNYIVVHEQVARPKTSGNHPMLTRLERHFAPEPDVLKRQLNADMERVNNAMKIWDRKRKGHSGELTGHQMVQELAGHEAFLDGWVHFIPPTRPAGYDITVLGDLHGCYSCLKAALLQSEFLTKVEKFKKAPAHYPEPLLVFLGDYIDRGLYSFEGVMRGVLGLLSLAPDHVIVLRGNHEHFLEKNGAVFAGVKPAEGMDGLKGRATVEMLQAYKQLFESMPAMLFFDDILMVHAGIPRDSTIRDHYEDLSSLNEPFIRHEMMWSDPSSSDYVPDELQASTNRFSFGREQARAFMHRMGVRTLIRGHEKVEVGYLVAYNEPDLRLITLFSAGGADNYDLPERSSYRNVTPTALTIRYREGRTDIEPWVIDYESYNNSETNEFYNVDE